MKFNTDKIEWTQAMKDTIISKAAILERVVDEVDKIEAKLFKLNDNEMKLVLTYKDYRVQSVGKDFYSICYDAVDRLKLVISRASKKITGKNKKKTGLGDAIELEEDDFFDFTKEKVLIVPSLSSEEAVERFEKTDYGFYVYKDCDQSDTISIIYRRHDDTYGVIRCKAN